MDSFFPVLAAKSAFPPNRTHGFWLICILCMVICPSLAHLRIFSGVISPFFSMGRSGCFRQAAWNLWGCASRNPRIGFGCFCFSAQSTGNRTADQHLAGSSGIWSWRTFGDGICNCRENMTVGDCFSPPAVLECMVNYCTLRRSLWHERIFGKSSC